MRFASAQKDYRHITRVAATNDRSAATAIAVATPPALQYNHQRRRRLSKISLRLRWSAGMRKWRRYARNQRRGRTDAPEQAIDKVMIHDSLI
jgi:hypothetical protein